MDALIRVVVGGRGMAWGRGVWGWLSFLPWWWEEGEGRWEGLGGEEA